MRVPTDFAPRRGKTAFGIYKKIALVNDAGKCARDKPVEAPHQRSDGLGSPRGKREGWEAVIP